MGSKKYSLQFFLNYEVEDDLETGTFKKVVIRVKPAEGDQIIVDTKDPFEAEPLIHGFGEGLMKWRASHIYNQEFIDEVLESNGSRV